MYLSGTKCHCVPEQFLFYYHLPYNNVLPQTLLADINVTVLSEKLRARCRAFSVLCSPSGVPLTRAWPLRVAARVGHARRHAVRRYIFENQGLVRRMYGDQRHSLIVGNELEARRLRYDDLRYHGPPPPPDGYTAAETGPRGRAAYRVRPNSRYANLLKTPPQADDEKIRPAPPPPPSPSQRPPGHSGGATAAAAVVTTGAGTSSVAATTTGAVPVATAPAVLESDATAYRPG